MVARPWSEGGGRSPVGPAAGRVRFKAALLLVLVVVVFSPLADASWFQAGNDAARTGVIPEPGPEFGDVAFVAQLPGSVIANLAINDGWVYAVTSDYGHPGGSAGAWRVELATGQVERLFDLPEEETLYGNPSFDGDHLYTFDGGALVARSLETGQEVGQWRSPLAADGEHTSCTDPTFDEGALFFACVVWPRPPSISGTLADPPSSPPGAPDSAANMVVASLDPATLSVNWVVEPDVIQGVDFDPEGEVRVPGGGVPAYVSLSVGADRVFLQTITGEHRTSSDLPVPLTVNHNEFMVWALDIDNGDIQWTEYGKQYTGFRWGDLPPVSELRSPYGVMVGSMPLVGPEAVYVRMDSLQALNIVTGDTIWSETVGQADSLDIPGGSGLGLFEEALIATSIQTAYRFDPTTGEPAWENRLPPGSPYLYTSAPVTLDGERAYFHIFGCEGGDQMRGIRAIDMASGDLVWERLTREPEPGLPYICWGTGLAAHAEGVIATGSWNGRLTVLGQTEASLRLPSLPHMSYPAVAETVRVDLSGTKAGVDGPPTRFMADWGDGTSTDWQEEPYFSHAYTEKGEKQARFAAANENQTRTAMVTYDVGGTPPREPNFIEAMFARDNQDLTFGVLGLLVALAGGAIALVARQRHRGSLQHELEAIERIFESTKHDAVQCDAALLERKAHCRGLLADGKIDEGQFSVLRERIDELARGLRLSTLDERFHFLPHGMVLSLRDMLKDGRISSWERDHVLRALDDDAILTKRQKEKVRRLVDDWFERDRGFGSAAD